MKRLKDIKYRMWFAFILGGLSNSIISYIGKMETADVFTIYDAIWVSFCILFIIIVTILATVEQIKNK